MDARYIESIYLVAAAGKLFHDPQELRKTLMFSFLLEFKVCSGEGSCTSLLELLSSCCAHPAQSTLLHGGDKMSILPPHLCGTAQRHAPCCGEFFSSAQHICALAINDPLLLKLGCSCTTSR